MRTLEEVQKITTDLDRELPESFDTPLIKSTDDIISSLLNRPAPGQNAGITNGTDQAAHNDATLQYYIPLRSDRKIIGRPIVFFKRAIRRVLKYLFTHMIDKQNTINAQTYAAINTLNSNNTILSERLSDDYNGLKAELCDRQNDMHNKLLVEFHDEINNANNNIILAKIEMDENNKSLIRQIAYEREKLEMSVFRAIYNRDKEKDTENLQPEKVIPSLKKAEFNYFDFENRFRGSRDHIKEKLECYVPYLKDCDSLIDLGCGRGELLELMRDNNIPAVGVDISEEFVDWCSFKELDAKLGDAVEYLATLEDNSIGAITGIQLVEHLSFESLVQLCDLAYKKLSSGGVMIFETVNPTCLAIYSNYFYVDPTHDKPVHPLLLKYIAEESGFMKVETLYTEQSKTGYKLPLLDAPANNIDEFNSGLNTISDLLFGSQDYAIIAIK